MSEMRDKIIQIIDAACASPDFDLEGNGRWADRILALISKPTGLVINRNGVITDLTADEAVEVLKSIITEWGGELNDGSSIELKEKP